MKRKVLAMLVPALLVAGAANAAEIYNKDGNKLSERYIRNIINKLVTKAGLDIKISPHTFRHTFATDMLEDGSDLMTVKELLGHESLNTTSIYTHVTNEQIKKVYEMAHPRAKK